KPAEESTDRDDPLRVGGVTFVGHRGAAHLAVRERLLELHDLGALELDDLVRDTRERPADQRQQRHELRDRVARGVPRDRRHAEPEMLQRLALDSFALRAEAGECTDGAAQLTDEEAWGRLAQPHRPASPARRASSRTSGTSGWAVTARSRPTASRSSVSTFAARAIASAVPGGIRPSSSCAAASAASTSSQRWSIVRSSKTTRISGVENWSPKSL